MMATVVAYGFLGGEGARRQLPRERALPRSGTVRHENVRLSVELCWRGSSRTRTQPAAKAKEEWEE